MKDAKGHGSNARGGASAISKIIPSKPAGPGGDQTIGGPQDRSGQAHTQALADQHGIDTSHLNEQGYRTQGSAYEYPAQGRSGM